MQLMQMLLQMEIGLCIQGYRTSVQGSAGMEFDGYMAQFH